MEAIVKRSFAGAVLIATTLILTACGESAATRQSVAQWLDATQIDLPKEFEQLSLTRLRHYDNQVIATVLAADADAFRALADTDAFDSVARAVCELPRIEVVWDAGHELYSSVESDSGSVLLTVQTKRFDCCVVDAMQSMSRAAAQNHCPYTD